MIVVKTYSLGATMIYAISYWSRVKTGEKNLSENNGARQAVLGVGGGSGGGGEYAMQIWWCSEPSAEENISVQVVGKPRTISLGPIPL